MSQIFFLALTQWLLRRTEKSVEVIESQFWAHRNFTLSIHTVLVSIFMILLRSAWSKIYYTQKGLSAFYSHEYSVKFIGMLGLKKHCCKEDQILLLWKVTVTLFNSVLIIDDAIFTSDCMKTCIFIIILRESWSCNSSFWCQEFVSSSCHQRGQTSGDSRKNFLKPVSLM